MLGRRQTAPVGEADTVRGPSLVIDGGDRACGELLLILALPLRGQPVGAVVRLIATDPVAAIDLQYWCHLTGHGYLGADRGADGRSHYDIAVRHSASAQHPHTDGPGSAPNGSTPPPRQ